MNVLRTIDSMRLSCCMVCEVLLERLLAGLSIAPVQDYLLRIRGIYSNQRIELIFTLLVNFIWKILLELSRLNSNQEHLP